MTRRTNEQYMDKVKRVVGQPTELELLNRVVESARQVHRTSPFSHNIALLTRDIANLDKFRAGDL
jgi:hypothetical protein